MCTPWRDSVYAATPLVANGMLQGNTFRNYMYILLVYAVLCCTLNIQHILCNG